MNSKWQIPVYVLVVGLVAFLIWVFVRPGQASNNIAANNAAEEPPKDDPKPNPIRPSPKNHERTDNPHIGARLPDGPVLDAKKPLRRHIVFGRVLESEGGAGIKNARLVFIGTGDLATFRGTGYSQADGSYRFLAWEGSTAPANLVGRAGARVHAQSPDGRACMTDEITLDPAGPLALPDIVIKTQGIITGQVVGADNEPARGVRVALRSGPLHTLDTSRNPWSVKTGPVYLYASADDNGVFEFRNLDASTYRISVDHCYYGSVGFTDIDLTRGGTVWHNLKLEREDWVRGVLRDTSGRPIPGAVVRLVYPLPGAPGSATADDGGETPEDVPHEDLRTTPPRDGKKDAKKGKTKAEREKERAERRKDGGFGKRPPKNPPTPKQPNAPPPEPHAIKCVTDEYGQFGFTKLEDLGYMLQAYEGGADRVLLDVKINKPDYTIELELRNYFAGTVLDSETGKPISRYDIREVGFGTGGPSAELKAGPLDRIADNADLAFHPAGRFALFNLDRKTRIQICAPGYVMRGENLEVKKGEERLDLEYKLDPLCNLEMVLRFTDGEAPKGVALPLEPVIVYYNAQLAFSASTDDFGRVRLPAVMPGGYDVQVQRQDGTLLTARVTVPATRNATLEVMLEKKK